MRIRISFKLCNIEDRRHWEAVENAVIKPGSFETWIPKEILEKIKVKPYCTDKFRRADGSIVKRKIGIALLEVHGKKEGCDVVFAERGDKPILGSIAVESRGMKIDPRTGRISFEPLLALHLGKV